MKISSTDAVSESLQTTPVRHIARKSEPHQNITVSSPHPNRNNSAESEQVQEAVDQIQKYTESLARNLNFSIDEDTGKTIIKVLDTQTQEVIRQIPSEETISIARTLGKIQGLLFNDKA
jgi:flagellar protein FlaG